MRNKKVLIAAVITLLLLFVVLEKTRITNLIKLPGKAVSSQGPTEEQLQQEAEANAEVKRQLIESNDKGADSTPTTAQSNKSLDLSAKEESNNTVTVFTKLWGYTSGSCDLVATNGAKATTQTAKIVYQREFSTCAGFSIPIDSLGQGTWTLKLSATSEGDSEIKTITLEVK